MAPTASSCSSACALSNPNAMVILTSAIASTSHVIEAMRLGAYDVLPKEKLTYELRVVIESAMRAVEARRATLAPTLP